MQKQDRNIKVWFEDRKDKIKYGVTAVGMCAAGIGVGVFVKGKWDVLCMSLGLQAWYNNGLIKFFNPETGAMVNPEEFCKILKRY